MAAEFSALCTWWDNYPKDAIANWLSEGAIMISCKCHVLSAMYRGWKLGGGGGGSICGMLIPFLVCFQLEVFLGLCLWSSQRDGVWHLTRCLARHLHWFCNGEARKVGEVPQFTPLQTCVAGPGLEEPSRASRSEHIFITIAKACIMLLKPDT